MNVTQKIKMDLLSKQNVQTIYAVRDDTNSRLVQINLFEGGVPWEVPSDAKIAIGYLASNGASGVYDTLPDGEIASMYDGNQITIYLVPAALYPGTTKVTVVVSDENDDQISTFPLNVEVDENYSYGASEPETYINLRQWMIAELEEIMEDVSVKPSDEQVAASVEAWLDAHPEVTTTVADGSITEEKLADKSVTFKKLADGMFDENRTANLINPDEHYVPNRQYAPNGTHHDGVDFDSLYMVPVLANTAYCVSPILFAESNNAALSIIYYDAAGSVLSSGYIYPNKSGFTAPNEAAFVTIRIVHRNNGADGIMIIQTNDKSTVDWDTYIPYYNYSLNAGIGVSTEQITGLAEYVDGKTTVFETKENAEKERSRRTGRVASPNLIDYETMVTPYKVIAPSGGVIDSEEADLVEMLPVKPETTYSISRSACNRLLNDRYQDYEAGSKYFFVLFFDSAKNKLSYLQYGGNGGPRGHFYFATPANCEYISFSFLHYDTPTVVLLEGSLEDGTVIHITPYTQYRLTDAVSVPKNNVPWFEPYARRSPLFYPVKVNISAHRGDMESFPENTIPAFESAARKGVFAIETDARPTSDGILMCLHDDTVDRTTNGTGKLADMTYEQAIALNIDYGPGIEDYAENPLKIPTFAEYLKTCKKYGCVALIHLQQSDEAYISSVYQAVSNLGMAQSSIFVSWSYDDVRAIRELDADCCVGVAYYGIDNKTLTALERLGGCIGVHALSKTAITEEVIGEAHRRGIYVFSGCDSNLASELEYWYNLGVDNIVHSFLNLSIL